MENDSIVLTSLRNKFYEFDIKNTSNINDSIYDLHNKKEIKFLLNKIFNVYSKNFYDIFKVYKNYIFIDIRLPIDNDNFKIYSTYLKLDLFEFRRSVIDEHQYKSLFLNNTIYDINKLNLLYLKAAEEIFKKYYDKFLSQLYSENYFNDIFFEEFLNTNNIKYIDKIKKTPTLKKYDYYVIIEDYILLYNETLNIASMTSLSNVDLYKKYSGSGLNIDMLETKINSKNNVIYTLYKSFLNFYIDINIDKGR